MEIIKKKYHNIICLLILSEVKKTRFDMKYFSSRKTYKKCIYIYRYPRPEFEP